jgi:hypothetical protein
MLELVLESTAAIGLCHGTLVLTPGGPVAAEALAAGALVLAVSGVAAPFQRLVAVEHVSVTTPLERVRAGALADGAPLHDLLLPSGHALLLDGALVAAGGLVDGLGVVSEPTEGPVALVRLALEGHDAVLADGAAVETASPHPDAPACAPRRAPDGTLRALLAWRAEVMGWAEAPGPDEPVPDVGSFRERLGASPLAPLSVVPLPIKPPR